MPRLSRTFESVTTQMPPKKAEASSGSKAQRQRSKYDDEYTTCRWWFEGGRLHIHNPVEIDPENVLVMGYLQKISSGKIAVEGKGPKLDIVRLEVMSKSHGTDLFGQAVSTFDARKSGPFIHNSWKALADDKKTGKALAGT